MKKRKGSLAVGFPTIVNILVLLLFTCVSLLALSRAQADRMTTAHGWDVTSNYFAADSRAKRCSGSLNPLLPSACRSRNGNGSASQQSGHRRTL